METSHSPGRIRKFLRRFRLPLLILTVACIAVWHLLPADVHRDPVLLARDDAGQLDEVEPVGGRGVNFNAHLGTLKANNSTTTSTSSSHSNPSFFSARSLTIVNLSDDVLMERIGTELLELLKEELALDRLEYYPVGHLPKPGSLGPDFFLTLSLDSKKHSGLLSDTLDANVRARIGSCLARSSYSVHDHLTPPTVRVNSEIRIEHHSTFSGVESSAAAYVLQGRDIAKQISGVVTKLINDLADKHDPMPEMPDGLRKPKYRPTPEFQFVDDLEASQLTTSRGLMIHNETFWKFTSSKPAADIFELAGAELTASDWTIEHSETKYPRSSVFRANSGSRFLVIFPAQRDQLPMSPDDPITRPVEYFVRYVDRVDRDSLQTLLEQILAQESPDLELLLALRGLAKSDLNRRIISLVEERKPGSVAGWMALAEAYSSTKDIEKCIGALRRLTCLKQTLTDASNVDSRIKSIAKKHELDESDYDNPSREDWLAAGLVEIKTDSETEAIEFGLNQTISFFAIGADGKAHVYSVKLSSDGSATPTATHLYSSNGSRSWSTVNVFHGAQTTDERTFSERGPGPERNLVTIRIKKLDDSRFEASAEVTPR